MKRANVHPKPLPVACLRLVTLWLFASVGPVFSVAQSLQVSLPDYSICQGSSVVLAPQVSGGAQPYTYAWSPAGSLSCSDCQNPVASPLVTTVYSLSVTDQDGGEAVASTIVSLTPGVSVSLMISDTAVCMGSSVTLTATPSGNTAACTYLWQTRIAPGNWTNIPNATGNVLTRHFGVSQASDPPPTFEYRVIIACPGGGCNVDTSNVVSVTRNNYPVVRISTQNNVVCIDDPLVLTARLSGGAGECLWQWSSSSHFDGPFTDIPGSTDSIYEPPTDAVGTMYYLARIACSGQGCGSIPFPQPAVPTRVAVVEQAPSISIAPADSALFAGDSITLASAVAHGGDSCTIQWQSAPDPGGPWLNIPGAGDASYSPSTDSPSGTTYFRAVYNCEAAPVVDDPLTVTIKISDVHNLSAGDKFCMDVVAEDSIGFIQFRLGLDFDFDKLKFLSAQNLGFPGMAFDPNVLSGPGNFWLATPLFLGVFWPDYNPQVYPPVPAYFSPGATLLSLCFEVLDDSAPVTINTYPAFTQMNRAHPLGLIKTVIEPGTINFGPNCFSAVSNISALTVQAPPSVSIDTANFAVCLGAPLTLRADTTDTSDACALQWQSAESPNGPWMDIPGADSLSFQPATNQIDTAYYRIVLSCPDTGGADTSNIATVIVVNGMSLHLFAVSPLCPGDLGLIRAERNPTLGNVTFSWSTGEIITTSNSQFTLSDLQPGIYCVTMTADNGCPQVQRCEVVVQPAPAILVVPNITPASCTSSADGAITATVMGGTPPYNYAWSNGAASPAISGLAGGMYTLTLTDANGCIQTQTYQILVTLTADAVAVNSITCNNPEAVLQGSASQSGPNIEYAWYAPDGTLISNQVTMTVSEAGLYRFRAVNTDLNDCYAEDEVLVRDLTNLIIEDMGMTLIACNTWRLEGIQPPDYFGLMDFEWTLPDGSMITAQSIIATQSGVYQLRISIPGSGCEAVVARFIDVGNDDCAVVQGRVVFDANDNCQAEMDEDGLAGWLVRATGAAGVFHAVTSADGTYSFSLPLGNYTVGVIPPTPSWVLCVPSYPVALTAAGQTNTLHIPVRSEVNCPELDVRLSAPFLRRCFSNNLTVRVCNTGTEAVPAPRVTLVLDDFLEYEGSQYTPESIDGQTITWVIPPLGPSGCRQFWVRVKVSCSATLGQAHCSTVTATPDSLCTPASPLWSGASLELAGECTDDQVVFRVRNAGTGDLMESVQYIVIEDVVMLMQMPGAINGLPSGAETLFEFPANGSTWFFSVEQAPFHPFSSVVTAALEGCGTDTGGAFSTGFINQLPLQTPTPASFTLCMNNIGAYDPNDKQAIPIGYGPQHFIRAGDPLQYKIRFQNTGTDTAFTVIIRDTLSPWLDIATLRAGPSSHDYRLDIDGERTLVFTFDNILLPDSTTNLEASQGFVDFFIRTLDSIPADTRIENSAAIYFDFNEPIITNTVFHTIGTDFIRSATAVFQPHPAYSWRLFPNPATDEAWLIGDQHLPGQKTIWIYDALGRLQRQIPFEGDRCLLRFQGLTPGWYALQVRDAAGRSVGVARLLLR